MMTDEQKIAKFNEQAIAYIVEHGTLKVEKEGRTLVIEVDSWRPDGSIDGFQGWFEDDHSMTILGDTPFEVYTDA